MSLLLLFLIKYSYPKSEGFPVCIKTLLNKGQCIFSSENVFGYNPNTVSRFENNLSFNTSIFDNKWRVGELNSSKYSLYLSGNEVDATKSAWIKKRNDYTYPLEVYLTINGDQFEKIRSQMNLKDITLSITHNGILEIYNNRVLVYSKNTFSQNNRLQDITNRIDIGENDSLNLSFVFRSYLCTDNINCFTPQNTESLPVDLSRLKIEVIDKYGIPKTITSNSLISQELVLATKILEVLLVFSILVLYFSHIHTPRFIDFYKFNSFLKNRWLNGLPFVILSILTMAIMYILYLRGYLFHPPKTYFILTSCWILLTIFVFSKLFLKNSECLKISINVSFSKVVLFLFFISTLLFPAHLRNILSFQPEIGLYPPGDDQLTYFSWGRDVLKNKTLNIDPTLSFSKPFFIYFRAAEIWIFGDNNTTLDSFMYWIYMTLPLLVCLILQIVLVRMIALKKYIFLRNIDNFLLTGAISIALWFMFFTSGGWAGTFAAPLSEGMYWFFSTLGFAIPLLLLSVYKTHQNKILFMSGMAMGISFLFRTPIVFLLLSHFGFVFILIQSVKQRLYLKSYINILFLITLPIFISAILMLLHIYFGKPDLSRIFSYISANTSVDLTSKSRVSFSSLKLIKYFPTFFEIFLYFVFIISYIKGAKRLNRNFVFLVAFIVSNVIFQIPFIATGYYPRGLFLNYSQISIFIIGLVLIYIIKCKSSKF